MVACCCQELEFSNVCALSVLFEDIFKKWLPAGAAAAAAKEQTATAHAGDSFPATMVCAGVLCACDCV